MKHSVIIMAHKDVDSLLRLVKYFEYDCDLFIHWDKKVLLEDEDVRRLYECPQVKKVLQEYEVFWGGTSVLECEMFMIGFVLKSGEYDYVHLLSGQDYPTRPLKHFLAYFEKQGGKDFMQYVHLPHPNWENNTFRRFQYYYPYDYAQGKKNPKRWVNEQVKYQYERRMKRPIPDQFDHIYGCSQWFSITTDSAKILLDYTHEHPDFYNRLWMTFAPEECYPATVLINLRGKENVVCDNLRYIRWKYENGNRPANLGEEHFLELLNRECFFARKMEKPYCDALLSVIDKYLIKAEEEVELLENGAWNYQGFLKYDYDASFAEFVAQLCCEIPLQNALDIGCGCGLYVAEWRRRGLPFAGYDANPYTEELSKLLLPAGDTPCGLADIAEEELECLSPFDLVVCKDVLPYIPERKLDVAIGNISKLAAHEIVLCWDVLENVNNQSCTLLDENMLISKFEQYGFVKDRATTARLKVVYESRNCCCLMKK